MTDFDSDVAYLALSAQIAADERGFVLLDAAYAIMDAQLDLLAAHKRIIDSGISMSTATAAHYADLLRAIALTADQIGALR